MKKFLLILGLFFCFNFAYAGLSVTPSVTNVLGEQGSVYKGKFIVRNTYDYPITIKVNFDKGNNFSGNPDISVENWLKFEKEKYDIAKDGQVEIPYEANILSNMKGSVSAKVEFSVDQGSMISISVVVPIYITVKGTENIDFNIDSLDFVPSEKGIAYKLILENNGNVHIRHTGQIEIYTKKKKSLVKTIPVPETVPTYCESKRTFNDLFIQKGELKKGKYVAVFKIDALGKQAVKEIKFKLTKHGEVITQ
ncbi:hypothetical protein [Candidatus Ruminimicrobium bovinum]|uniref:COG1470 family protein n=1 Tax=Candidatus Ruminimicrobium bovinum TaxID=3242779 RepID=UPI0039B8819F